MLFFTHFSTPFSFLCLRLLRDISCFLVYQESVYGFWIVGALGMFGLSVFIRKVYFFFIRQNTEIGRGLDSLGYLGYLLVGCLCFGLNLRRDVSSFFVSSRICRFTCYGFWVVGALGRFELSVSIQEAVFGFFASGLFLFLFLFFFFLKKNGIFSSRF